MQVLILFAVLAVASAKPLDYDDEDSYAHTPAHYQFEYGVASPLTGDIKSQKEHREGHLVDGEYALRESDGTTRLVRYKSTPHDGFQAIVQRAGIAVHPALATQSFGGHSPGFAGHGFGGKTYGGHVYGGHTYGGYKYGGHGVNHLGGQGLGLQAFGGQGLEALFGGTLGNSYVGTTAWGNQGPEHGHGKAHGY